MKLNLRLTLTLTVNKESFFDELSHPIDADLSVERDEALRHGVPVRHPELLVATQRRRVEHPHAEVVVRLDGRSTAAAPRHDAADGHRQRHDYADEHDRRTDGRQRRRQVDDGHDERQQHAAVERVDEPTVARTVKQPGSLLDSARDVETVGQVEGQRRHRPTAVVRAFRLASRLAGFVVVVGGR